MLLYLYNLSSSFSLFGRKASIIEAYQSDRELGSASSSDRSALEIESKDGLTYAAILRSSAMAFPSFPVAAASHAGECRGAPGSII